MNADTKKNTGDWLGFELAGQHYAVPLADVREILHLEDPTPVPGALSEVVGIINLRGTLVTVLDGCTRLGLAAASPIDVSGQRLVIFHGADEDVGMRVDALRDVLACAADELLPPPAGRAARDDDPVLGVIQRDDGFIALLDARKLCAAAAAIEGVAA